MLKLLLKDEMNLVTCNQNIDIRLNHLLQHNRIEHVPGLEIKIAGKDPVMDSPWRIGEASATALAAYAAAVTGIWNMRSRRFQSQSADIDIITAALSTMRCHFLRQNGYPVPLPDIDYPTVGLYETGDGKYVFINGGYPELRRGLLRVLDCPDDRTAISKALGRWKASEIESVLQGKELCCAMCRSPEEWISCEQGRALYFSLSDNGFINPVEIEKISESAPQPFTGLKKGNGPLSNIRIIDNTHVLAGPTCGMMLAGHDAVVMRINGPQVPVILPFVMDTGHGKLNTQIDLKNDEGKKTLWKLIDDGADVITDSYRPGKLDCMGFSPEAIAERMKNKGRGIIYVSINCYGHTGPWKNLPGWEQLAQAATGLAYVQGGPLKPQLLPTYPDDYITGYLAAFGILASLIRRNIEGGSYHVKVSLCATAMWLQSFGRVNSECLPPEKIAEGKIESMMINNDNTGYGRLKYFGHPVDYSVTKAGWKHPTVPVGYNRAVWPDDK